MDVIETLNWVERCNDVIETLNHLKRCNECNSVRETYWIELRDVMNVIETLNQSQEM